MKKVKLLHNPNAGEGEFAKKRLISLIRAAGFDCNYSSTKNGGWGKIESKGQDFVIVAGGDGTVRKLAKSHLQRRVIDKRLPIALLPFGTANNIGKTLNIQGTPETIIDSWKHGKVQKFDVGRIDGLSKPDFFLEGFGYGVFPRLMEEMAKLKKKDSEPEEHMKVALETLHEIVLSYRAKSCKILVDGLDYSGKYLMVELMNTRSIGPNLNLDPIADPGDGKFELVLVPEGGREEFAQYVTNKLNGTELPPFFKIVKLTAVQLCWEGKMMHVDDTNIKMSESREIAIEMLPGALEFIVQ